MYKIIDGKELAKKIRNDLKIEVEKIKQEGINPKFAVILVGEDKASKIYVKNKTKACIELGIEFEEILLEENIQMQELLKIIENLNNREDIHGILLQSPIPSHLDINEAFRTIKPEKDVDGFNPVNVGKLSLNQDCFVSCTPFGIIKMLENYNIEIEGKRAVVVGRSNIVGKPVSMCLLNKNATVTVCHSKTKDLKKHTLNSDIVICAVGKPKFLTEDMISEGTVVVDVGISRVDGKVVGDVDFENVKDKCSYISPVPGGVGPMTIAMVLENILNTAKK